MAVLRALVLILTLVAALAAPAVAATAVVPPVLRDVTGAAVDVDALAHDGRLVFVTVKAAWCPVCRAQLARLGRILPRLRACGVSFIVLAPGGTETVAAIARETSFPFPFVAEDAVALANAAGFAASADELVPGFFAVNADRQVVWEQRGRGAGNFGDGELLAWLGCKGASPSDLLARADVRP